MQAAQTDILDPVFASVGMEVYTYEYVESLRKENLERKKNGQRLYNLIPQRGFQEDMMNIDADIKIIGGKRGLGKTFIGLYDALPYIFNPEVSMYGFRKYEDDVARGIWKSSFQVYRYFGTPVASSFQWNFLQGKGATMKMEHLQDQKKVSDRFRGVEMAYILIEELAEHTRENLDVLFDLLASNRSTAGVRPKCVCTCNPVGRSNALRHFVDWWIDPDTNLPIPERNGKIRYFYRYGNNVDEIVWGDSPQEVYVHPNVMHRIDALADETGSDYSEFITSMAFITGDYADNEILKVSDPKYLNRISARGGASTHNDIIGKWEDVDDTTGLLTMEDMYAFFDNTEQRNGVMRASADVALTGDFMVLFAFDGYHVCDMEAWRGVPTDEIRTFIDAFLYKNNVRYENFTYDSNGLGLWLKDMFKGAQPFNNKSKASNSNWKNLKSECADMFVRDIRERNFSIDEQILKRTFTDKKKNKFVVEDRLMEERRALQRKENNGECFEIISKQQMKTEVGHSPDFIEALMMVELLMREKTRKKKVRKGFDMWM
jgi:hypothetical protein